MTLSEKHCMIKLHTSKCPSGILSFSLIFFFHLEVSKRSETWPGDVAQVI
jgi:hypothetical protein